MAKGKHVATVRFGEGWGHGRGPFRGTPLPPYLTIRGRPGPPGMLAGGEGESRKPGLRGVVLSKFWPLVTYLYFPDELLQAGYCDCIFPSVDVVIFSLDFGYPQ